MSHTHIINRVSYWAKVIVLGLIVGLGMQIAFAWTTPTSAPPGGNVSGPITTSSIQQTKLGNLILGNDLAVSRNAVLGGYVSVSNTDGLCLSGICKTQWEGVPPGAIILFSKACPAGWDELTTMRGRSPIGEAAGNHGSLDTINKEFSSGGNTLSFQEVLFCIKSEGLDNHLGGGGQPLND
jgi:hypothetical protein